MLKILPVLRNVTASVSFHATNSLLLVANFCQVQGNSTSFDSLWSTRTYLLNPSRLYYPSSRRTQRQNILIMSESNGNTRLAYILGVPLANNCERQWPHMDEMVKRRKLIAAVEGNSPQLTLEVGRRLHLNDDVVVVVEWSCHYGDGRMFCNVTLGELRNGEAYRVTDYWGEPTATPAWRKECTAQLSTRHAPDGIWKHADHVKHH